MPSSPSLFLFDRLVQTYQPDIQVLGRVLTSEDKQAFGFNDVAQDDADAAVRNLVLEADLNGLPGCSSLILRGGVPHTCIHTVDRDLILIASDFPGHEALDVFLIYDAVDGSLRMIPTMPRTYTPIRTAHVLVARRQADDRDDDRSYALVFPGTDAQGDAVLFVSPSSSRSPWSTVKKARFPTRWLSGSWFCAQQVFSFRGRGYWVDLLCGGMYCECADVLSQDTTSTSVVDIKPIGLPVGCEEYLGPKANIAQVSAFRAMGPVGDSVKFVSIDGYLELLDLKDWKVRIWRLMEDSMNWAVEDELKLASLWEGGDFKGDYAVPDSMAPMYPFLSTHEDHVIYFALGPYIRGKKNCFPKDPCCMLRVDLCTKTFNCTKLSPEVRTYMGVHLPLCSNTEGKLLGLPTY